MSSEVHKIQDQIRRRLAVGSNISERALKEDLIAQDFSPVAIDKALYILSQKGTLQYKQRRMVIFRAGY